MSRFHGFFPTARRDLLQKLHRPRDVGVLDCVRFAKPPEQKRWLLLLFGAVVALSRFREPLLQVRLTFLERPPHLLRNEFSHPRFAAVGRLPPPIRKRLLPFLQRVDLSAAGEAVEQVVSGRIGGSPRQMRLEQFRRLSVVVGGVGQRRMFRQKEEGEAEEREASGHGKVPLWREYRVRMEYTRSPRIQANNRFHF